MILIFFLLQLPFLLHFILGCGGKKKKSGKNSSEPSKKKRAPPPFPTVKQSESKEIEPKPEDSPSNGGAAKPPKPPSPPKPIVQDTKVAEMLPESIKEDEMKGGIQLPCPPKNMKLEGDVAPKEKKKEEKKDEIM